VTAVVLAAIPYFYARAETAFIDLFLFADLASFGQQAYLGVGAYADYLYAAAGVDPALGVVLAAAAVSLPVSLLVLRLTAGYFAVATWVVAEVLHLLATVSPRVGGNTGVSLPGVGRYPLVLSQAITYWWALGLALGRVADIAVLMRSRFGLDARAVHFEPTAAAAAGVAVAHFFSSLCNNSWPAMARGIWSFSGP
jgi:branched-chain amino acid transport system permease protein